MLEILTLQLISASLGTAMIGAADWLHDRGRIRQRVHALWVSASSTGICLPLLTWTTNVFLGFGVFSEMLIGAISAIMFLWIYHRLRKVPTEQKLKCRLFVSDASGRPIPRSSDIGFGTDPIGDINHLHRQIPPPAERRRAQDVLPR